MTNEEFVKMINYIEILNKKIKYGFVIESPNYEPFEKFRYNFKYKKVIASTNNTSFIIDENDFMLLFKRYIEVS